jgi:heptosyltransferase-2
MGTARPPARILIIKTHAIGDLLMATPAIRDLRAAHPSAHIALLVGKWSAPAIRNNPHLDAIIEFDDRVLLRGDPIGILRLLAKVRGGRFDAAVIFHPSPYVHLFALLAGIPVRYGLKHGKRAPFLTAGVVEDLGEDAYYPVNFQRVAALAGAVPGPVDLEVHADAAAERAAGGVLSGAGIFPGDDFVLVAPGGGRNSKEDVAARRWPADRFAALLGAVRRDYPGLKIALTGTSSDARETGVVLGAVPGAADLTGKTSLPELYAVARRARAVICNDSSLLHIAVACRRPVVAPFGPTGLRQRLPQWAIPFSLQSGIPCSPCYVGGRFPGCPIGFQCMRETGVDAMLGRLRRALGNAAADAPASRPSYIA